MKLLKSINFFTISKKVVPKSVGNVGKIYHYSNNHLISFFSKKRFFRFDLIFLPSFFIWTHSYYNLLDILYTL